MVNMTEENNIAFSENPEMIRIQRERRARQLAKAFWERIKIAEIPPEYCRIKEDKFRSLLSPEFHGTELESFSKNIYDNPIDLMTKKYILIDGGNEHGRLSAAFAILFSIIVHDKWGIYKDCVYLKNKFQTINATDSITRNQLIDEIKEYDVLFIGEFCRRFFNPHFESGDFMDELLGYRTMHSLPTIITFIDPIASIKDKEKLAAQGMLNSDCGKHFARLCLEDKTTDKILRIRVKARL
jgi:hypothetical protein